MKILIVGYGNIGKHMYQEFKALDPWVYDPFIPKEVMPDKAVHRLNYDHYDIAFVCVPTDMLEDGSANTCAVEVAVSGIDADVIVIKSTVPVGTTNSLAEKFGKKIVFSPEFYGVTQHAPASPDWLLLGGAPSATDRVAQAYYKVKPGAFRITYTDSRTAELSKYMINSFLALKVTFCNEFAALAPKLHVHYERLRELFVLDPRVGDSHTFALEDQPYYDSHCFNKDVPALLATADSELLTTMVRINNVRKTLTSVAKDVREGKLGEAND